MLGVVFRGVSELDEEFWARFHATWPDMYSATRSSMREPPTSRFNEALCARHEGRVADLEADGNDHTSTPPEPFVIRIGAGNAHFVRRADESDED